MNDVSRYCCQGVDWTAGTLEETHDLKMHRTRSNSKRAVGTVLKVETILWYTRRYKKSSKLG